MAEYRGESKWDLPLSDRTEESWVCHDCGEPLDRDGECIGCLDAYWDAMESRQAHFDEYQHGGKDDE